VADTVRRVTGTLNQTHEDTGVARYAAQYTDTAAKKLDDVARYLEGADVKQMARDLQSYARRNPAVFFGSAFTLGILAARFLKSSPQNGQSLPHAQDVSHQLPSNTGGNQPQSGTTM